jgi:cysteine desulfurase / selenocysteine lyase
MIYLDNAATSWPTPECVQDAMVRYMREIGANPGRSAHRRANEAEGVRFDARQAIAELFGVRDPMRVVFSWNATVALNVAIHGLLRPGDHAVVSGMEHNAVMRPLRALEAQGVEITVLPCRPDGTLDPAALEPAIRPRTRLIACNHASNVCGTILPIRELGAIARAHKIPLLVDAAQTAGCLPIDLTADNVDLLAFTGHKGLLGPTGTGGLVLRDDFDIDRLPPLLRGGTGSRSDQELQPEFLPDKYEPGTPNITGIAGLLAGVRYLQSVGIEQIRRHEQTITQRLLDGLGRLCRADGFGRLPRLVDPDRPIQFDEPDRPNQLEAGVRPSRLDDPGRRPLLEIQGVRDAERQTAVISFTVAGREVSDVAQRLDEEFEIMCRPGLHCSPAAHRTLGTWPSGTIRFAPGFFTTEAEIDQVVAAVEMIVGASPR